MSEQSVYAYRANFDIITMCRVAGEILYGSIDGCVYVIGIRNREAAAKTIGGKMETINWKKVYEKQSPDGCYTLQIKWIPPHKSGCIVQFVDLDDPS